MDVAFVTSAFQEGQYPVPDRPEIAFAGRSNVGKSSLINALTNRRKLARTSSTPGRTQSINFFSLGDSLYLVDLPGYGFARVPPSVQKQWKGMVETYLNNRSTLKAVVLILDIRRDPSDGDLDLIRFLQYCGRETIAVFTKADKVSRQESHKRTARIQERLSTLTPIQPVLFSAKTRMGREEIWKRIRLATGTP